MLSKIRSLLKRKVDKKINRKNVGHSVSRSEALKLSKQILVNAEQERMDNE